jgi:hypothetical protein
LELSYTTTGKVHSSWKTAAPFLKMLKIELPHEEVNPLLGTQPIELKVPVYTKPRAQMLTAVSLFYALLSLGPNTGSCICYAWILPHSCSSVAPGHTAALLMAQKSRNNQMAIN